MKNEPISINKLLVNPENPRFDPVKNQQEAIILMMETMGDEVFSLAKDIARHGLNPSKKLIVIKDENGMFLTLEGNRRVVALKLLQNPELVTNNKWIESFKSLKEDPELQLPNNVECCVFPDRESAFRWINLEHTGKNSGVGIVKWDHEQKSRFIKLYSGKHVTPAVQLFDFANQYKISHHNVDATTLNRLVSTPYVREQIGINFPNGVLEVEKSTGNVISSLQKVFTAMADTKFKVGDVYTNVQRKTWIQSVLDLSEKDKMDDAKSHKKKIDPFDGNWISNQLYAAYPTNNRVKVISNELKGLSPKTKPNICATSLRVLLELAVYIFLKENGKIKQIIDEEKRKLIEENKKRKEKGKEEKSWDNDWAPSFQWTVGYMASHDTIIEDPLERRALQAFISKNSKDPFLFEMNQFIHNPDYEPNQIMITEIWNKLGKLIFRTILSKNAKSKS